MRLTQYLIEKHLEAKTLVEKHELVLQQVLDGVDNGHVEYSDSKIMFDIGDISDTPKLRGLKLVIRPGKEDSIKLGQGKDGNYAIVINTTQDMPGRQDIDTFLASKAVYAGFRRAYQKYVKNHHDHEKEYEDNDTQKRVKMNSREDFEASYNDLINAINNHHGKYSSAVGEIDKEMDQIANIGRKKALELAKDNLRDEYLGKSDKEFVSKVLGLPEAEWTKHLDKEWKSKLEARLGNYYRSKYSK